MASLFGSAILTTCIGLHGSYYEACSKGLDAGTRQAGIRAEADSMEKRLNDISKEQAYKWFGKEGAQAVGFVGFAVKSANDKKLVLKLPNLGLCNSVSNEISKDAYKLIMRWNF